MRRFHWNFIISMEIILITVWKTFKYYVQIVMHLQTVTGVRTNIDDRTDLLMKSCKIIFAYYYERILRYYYEKH